MITIIVPEREYYDETKNEFRMIKQQKLVLEHSLLSISKWESKWNKSFFKYVYTSKSKLLDYIRCMTITPNVDPLVYFNLSEDNIKEISDYIKAPMSATVFYEEKHNSVNKKNKEITSELIYYWMAKFNLPFDVCEKWHFNRLQALLRICAIESGDNKMNKQQTMMSNREINALRRAKYKTRG